MARRETAASRRAAKQTRWAWVKIGAVVAVIAVLGVVYYAISSSNRRLDETTLCPTHPDSNTVLLVDVTDPMTVAQRQDFFNELQRLKNSIPRYGRLTVIKVDSASEHLLSPVIERCNPGAASDVSELSGNPKAVEEQRTRFNQSLDQAFESLTRASGADASPILESVQSAALTVLQAPGNEGQPRRLIIVSDLLQNTAGANFYQRLPDPSAFIESPAFRRARTDLRGVDVELWMLERPDTAQTQPSALRDLWTRIIEAQGGSIVRQYRVSG